MSHNLRTVTVPSTPRGTFRSNSATADEIRRLIQSGLKSGGIRRAAVRMANGNEEVERVADYLYDQIEGHSALIVSTLAELSRECPPQTIERVKAVLFDERPGASAGDVVSAIARITREFGELQAALGEALEGDHRIDPHDKPKLRRHLHGLIAQATEALQRLDQEPSA